MDNDKTDAACSAVLSTVGLCTTGFDYAPSPDKTAIMCTKCKREPAEINDGDDASGPPVCCGCYSGGPILGEDRRCFDLLNVFAGYGKPKKGT